MPANSSERPTAEKIHIWGERYLETGHWKLPEKETKEAMTSKRFTPYLLATAVAALLLTAAYWAYVNNHLGMPEDRLQNMATPVDQQQDSDIDAMIIATLEDELEDLRKRTLELEEENRQLRRNNAPHKIFSQNKDSRQEEQQKQPTRQAQEAVGAQKQAPPARQNPEAVIEENKDQLAKKAQPEAGSSTNTGGIASTSATPPAEDNSLVLPKKIEQQLNKIADPGISEKERAAWKQETMAHFAEGGVRIVDETGGASRQYSTSIFLNLLFKVPHTIVVKEIKSNENQKITELRLSMQSKM